MWVQIWLAISSLICVWDAFFVLNRPDSFENLIWSPYKDYVKVDKMYGDMKDDFVYSQSIMNLVEVSLNIFALQRLFSGREKEAMIVAIIVSTMTCSKTILYHLMEIVSGFKNTGHNDNATFFLLYLFPNGVWIWIPAAIMYVLSCKLMITTTPSTSTSAKQSSSSKSRSRSKTPSKKKASTTQRRSARLRGKK